MEKIGCNCCNKRISREEGLKVKEDWKKLFRKLFNKEPREENWNALLNQMKNKEVNYGRRRKIS